MNAAAVQATVQAAARDAVASVTKIIKEADSQQLKIAIGSASAAVVVAVALYRRASKPPPPPPPPPPRKLELTQLHSFDVPKELTIPHYFDLDAAEVRAGCPEAVGYLRGCGNVTEALDGLHGFVISQLEQRALEIDREIPEVSKSSPRKIAARKAARSRDIILAPGAKVAEGAILDASGGQIYLGQDVSVEPGALVKGPAYICEGCVVRHGAYIRGDVYLGAKTIVGGELKHMLALDSCELPHYGYCGDSLLGHKAHFGCGSLTANLPLLPHSKPACTLPDGNTYVLGRKKFGAIVGDRSQLGCGSVTEPGCLLAPNTCCYPLTRLARGLYGPDELLKNRPSIERVPLRPPQPGLTYQWV